MTITTRPFRTNSSEYIREIMLRWLSRRVWVFALILGVCIALSAIYDTAFLFLAVILLFLIFPFVLTNVYFNYALTPNATRWRRTRHVEITPDELRVEYGNDEDLPGKVPQPEVYSLSTVTAIKPGKYYDTVFFSDRLDDFVIINPESFPETEKDADSSPRAQFHGLIYSVIHQNSLSLRS